MATTNILGMSDSDFEDIKLDDSLFDIVDPAEEIKEEKEATAETEETSEVKEEIKEEVEESEDIEEASIETKKDTTTLTEEISDDDEPTEKESSQKEEETKDEDEEEVISKKVVEETKDTIDYKSEFTKLTSPFKANGKNIHIDNVDDAIKLMQMGANYHIKMRGLKPNLKIIKMLENNDLLDVDKISFLIDLNKKDSGAINKLVKDSKIDPLDLDKDKEYTPNTYTVNDSELALDSTLSDIRGSKSYAETVDIISNKWDSESKAIAVESPEIIKVINEHVELGIYSRIFDVVERERMLGRLQGMNDIQAYKHISEAINSNGGLESPDITEPIEAKSTTKINDTKLKDRKRNAGNIKAVSKNKKTITANPLAMSDEEFAKLDPALFT